MVPWQKTSKKRRYSQDLLEKDITNFNSYLKSEISLLSNDILDNSIKESLYTFIDDISKNNLYYVMDTADLNNFEDLIDSNSEKLLFPITNLESYVLLIIKNISKNLKNTDIDSNLLNEVYTKSYFQFIETKRIELLQLRESEDNPIEFNYPYFWNIYKIKQLYKNVSISKQLNFKELHNSLIKTKEREGFPTLEENFSNSLAKFNSETDNLKNLSDFQSLIDPNIIVALSYSAELFIEQLNRDFILPAGSKNARNTLSVSRCLAEKYLPVYLVPKNIRLVNGEIGKINTPIIFTTLKALLSRYNWNIWNPEDSLWHSLSHFWNMIDVYDDDRLHKNFYILSDSEFEEFYAYIDTGTKILKDLRNTKSNEETEVDSLNLTSNNEARLKFDEIMLQAIKTKSTDIHLRYKDNRWQVNLRSNTWVIIEHEVLNKDLMKQVIFMLMWDAKVSNFESSQKPQDWHENRLIRDNQKTEEYNVDLRYSFSRGGTSAFIRLWTIISNKQKKTKLKLNDLWLKKENLESIMFAIENNANGLVIVTWPTGSWKTTLLYSIIEDQLPKNDNVHLLTAEDPIERNLDLPNVDQHLITPTTTAHVLLKSFMRQDPDWILVGETRDKTLLDTTIDASQTWHLTFTTLHTNSSVESLDRLCQIMSEWDLNVYEMARKNILSILRLIVSVKLIPVLCQSCALDDTYQNINSRLVKKWFSEEKIDKILKKDWIFKKRNHDWCEKCDKGFKGRQIINDIMNLSNENVHTQVSNRDYSGIVTLFEDGMTYVNEWKIDIETLARNSK